MGETKFIRQELYRAKMPTNIMARTAKATTNHHLSRSTTLIFDRIHRGRGAVCFAFAKKVKSWIIEIMSCWNVRCHSHARRCIAGLRCSRVARSVLEVVFDFFSSSFWISWTQRPLNVFCRAWEKSSQKEGQKPNATTKWKKPATQQPRELADCPWLQHESKLA